MHSFYDSVLFRFLLNKMQSIFDCSRYARHNKTGSN